MWDCSLSEQYIELRKAGISAQNVHVTWQVTEQEQLLCWDPSSSNHSDSGVLRLKSTFLSYFYTLKVTLLTWKDSFRQWQPPNPFSRGSTATRAKGNLISPELDSLRSSRNPSGRAVRRCNSPCPTPSNSRQQRSPPPAPTFPATLVLKHNSQRNNLHLQKCNT